MVSLAEMLFCGTCTSIPRNHTGSVENAPSNIRLGLMSLPVEPCKETARHLATLAFIPDHCSQSETMESRC